MAPSTDVAAKPSAAELAQLTQIEAVLRGDAEMPPAPDAEAMSRSIMERILSASTVEEIASQQNLTPFRSLLDRPVRFTDVRFNRSTIQGDGAVPVYAVCDVTVTDTGEALTVSCGGRNVLAQLVSLLRIGQLYERTFQMIENDTAQGYGALWLEVVGD